jgi:hypothetical protein
MNTQECEHCTGKFTEDEMTDDAGEDTMLCLPCFYACENCDKRREGVDYDGFCDECDKELAYCSGKNHYNVKIYLKSEMKKHGDEYYCCSECEVDVEHKKCDECGDVVDEDDITEMHGKVVCESCRYEVRTCDDEKCDECSARHWADDCVRTRNGKSEMKEPKIVFTGKRRKRILPPVKA